MPSLPARSRWDAPGRAPVETASTERVCYSGEEKGGKRDVRDEVFLVASSNFEFHNGIFLVSGDGYEIWLRQILLQCFGLDAVAQQGFGHRLGRL